MMVGCYDCGLEYGAEGWIEAIIPDKVWNFISPTKDSSGILCINCISKRLALSGFHNIPIWLCGTEPVKAKVGNPGENLNFLRNWEPKLLKKIKRMRRVNS